MPDEQTSSELRWRFSLWELFAATAVVALALASWHYMQWLALLGLPIWTGLTAAFLSGRPGSAFAWVFIVWFWVGYVVMLLLICNFPFSPSQSGI